jgi:hypothetical protein
MGESTVTASDEVVVETEEDQVNVTGLQQSSRRGLSWTTHLGERGLSRRPVAFRT